MGRPKSDNPLRERQKSLAMGPELEAKVERARAALSARVGIPQSWVSTVRWLLERAPEPEEESR